MVFEEGVEALEFGGGVREEGAQEELGGAVEGEDGDGGHAVEGGLGEVEGDAEGGEELGEFDWFC